MRFSGGETPEVLWAAFSPLLRFEPLPLGLVFFCPSLIFLLIAANCCLIIPLISTPGGASGGGGDGRGGVFGLLALLPSLAHGGSFLQYAATAMATKGKAGSSAAPVVDAAAAVSDNAAAAAERASREYELALRRWATANGVPYDAALVLPSTLTSPHPAVPYPYAAPGWLSPPSPVYHSHSPSHSPLSPAHPYHGSNGYGMIPPANVASPPYLYAPAGGAYSPPQPPQPPPAYSAQTSGRWAEEFPTLGGRSARSSAGSSNGGGAFASKPASPAPSKEQAGGISSRGLSRTTAT